MTADRIEPLDKRRCKVFLDGDFAFVLYRGELRKYHIEEGAEVPDILYREIFDKVICRRARERALYLLKFSARTEAELKRKLRAGFYPERAIEEAVEFLKTYRYLDDTEYAGNYIEVYGRHKSSAELKAALLKKGVDKACIEQLLRERPPDEETQIRNLLAKRRYSPDSSIGEKQKTMGFLLRKGFSYEKIRRVIGDISEDRYE